MKTQLQECIVELIGKTALYVMQLQSQHQVAPPKSLCLQIDAVAGVNGAQMGCIRIPSVLSVLKHVHNPLTEKENFMKCFVCKKDKNYFTELHLIKIHKHKDRPKVLVCEKCLGWEGGQFEENKK